MTACTKSFRCSSGAVLVLLAGCSSYWPLSEELESEIRAEASVLTPAIDDHGQVVAVAEQAASAELPPPENFPLPEDCGLAEYVDISLERNPSIQAAIRNLEALGMEVPQVTSLADPVIAISPPTGRDIQTAAGEVQTTLGLSQTIPFPTKLAARGRVAEQAVRIGLEHLHYVRLKVIAEVKSAYYSYYLSTVSIDVTREHRALLERILSVADGKFRAGAAPQQDVLRAEVELYQLSNELLTLQQEQHTAAALLNVLMDRAVAADLPRPRPFDPRQIEWELERLMARAVERNPALKEVQEQVRRDLEEIRLAKLEYLPDFAVGAGYSFIGGGISPVATGTDVFDLTLGMTLPVWLQRIRAGVLQRNAESLARALEYRSRRNDIFFAIQDALVRVNTHYRSSILLRDGILPRARQTVEVSESGYQSGQVDFLTWINNWRRLLDFTLEYHTALAGLEESFALLEELAGGALPGKSDDEAEAGRGEDARGAEEDRSTDRNNRESSR